MKRTSKILFGLTLAAALSISCLFGACDNGETTPNGGTSSDGPQNEQRTDFTVTFHYGFDPASATLDASGRPSAYTGTQALTSRGGNRVTVSAAIEAKFDVEGYKVIGYDTMAWQQGGIAADMDVHVLYAPLGKVTVTFANWDGSVIKTVNAYEGQPLSAQSYPDTSDPVILLDAERYAALGQEDKAAYEAYGTYYVKKGDKERLATSIALPIGYVFESWTAAPASVTEDITVKTVVKQGDGVVENASGEIAIDAVKDASYKKLFDLTHGVVQSSRGGATGEIKDESAWRQAATPVGGTAPLDASLYATQYGGRIYFYVEVKDEKVATRGKSYYDRNNNPWMGDAVELWYGIGGKYHKIIIDAFGYSINGTTQADKNSAYYDDFIGKGSNFATRLFDAQGMEVAKGNDEAHVAEGAVGYAVEFSLPAYEEPSSSNFDKNTIGGNGWGKALTGGSSMYLALQIDSISSAPTQADLDPQTGELRDGYDSRVDLMAYGFQMLSANSAREGGKVIVLG